MFCFGPLNFAAQFDSKNAAALLDRYKAISKPMDPVLLWSIDCRALAGSRIRCLWHSCRANGVLSP